MTQPKNKRNPMTPHIYLHYYPKLKKKLWRVTETPKPYTYQLLTLYKKANKFTNKRNGAVKKNILI